MVAWIASALVVLARYGLARNRPWGWPVALTGDTLFTAYNLHAGLWAYVALGAVLSVWDAVGWRTHARSRAG